jgi:streptogramin lyase
MMRTKTVVGFLGLFFCLPFVGAGEIETVAGTGKDADGGAAGPALETNVGNPFGVEIGPDGALYITEVSNHRVRRLDLKSGKLTTVAGCGREGYAGDGGPAQEALLNEPYEVRFDGDGNMYFVEMQNHLVRRVDAKTARISTVAGTGKPGFGGDGGPAAKALFRQPHSIALDGRGGLYVADIGNHRIRRVDLKSGKIESIAGNGERKPPVDGQTVKGRPILGPRALAIDGRTMWIALREGNSVWALDLESGVIRHVAGTGEKGFGPAAAGARAKEATFNGPKGIAVGPDKRVYVVDTENQVIRRIDPSRGTIDTIAGAGPKSRGYNGDGQDATRAFLNRPHGICLGPDGSIYIGDSENHRVRRVRNN